MIRRTLRALRHIDQYEWVGIACGVIILATLTGVLGPTLDAQTQTLTACQGCGNAAVAAKE